jgi:excisionase family DNA binding protein
MTPKKGNCLPPKANLRIKEVADFLDVSDSTIYDMINEGALPCLVIKGQKRVPRAEFEIWYRAQIQQSAEPTGA